MAELVIKLVNGELAGKTMQSITKEVSAAALALKKAEIGTQAWVDANAKLDSAKKLQEDLKKQIQSTASASDILRDAFNKLPGAKYFNQTVDSFKMMKTGVGGLISEFGVLKTAIAATGIGLIVLAVAALVTAFSRFTPLVDKVEQVLGGLEAIVGEVVERLISLGKGLWAIINGNFKDGFNEISNSATGLGDAMKEAYTKGSLLVQLQQDLEDAARGLEIANAKAEAGINRLIIQAKNKGLSDQAQIDLLQKARKIAEENFKIQDAQKEEEFNALIKEAQLKSTLSKEEILQLTEGTLAYATEYAKRGTINDDLLDKIKDAAIERINAEGATNKQLEKIDNAEQARLLKQQAAAEKAAAEAARRRAAELAALRKQAEEELAARQNIEDLKLAMEEEGLQKQIDTINLETKRKIEALKGSDAQIMDQALLLEDLQAKLILAAREKNTAALAEADKKAKEDQLKRDRQALDDKIALIDLGTSTELNTLNELHIAGVVSQQDYVTRAQNISIEGETQKLALIKDSYGIQSQEYQDQFAKVLSLQTASNDTFLKSAEDLNAKLAKAVDSTLGTFAGLFGSLAGLFEQGTKQYKAFATAQAIISTIQGSINAYTAAQNIPYVGSILAPIAAAAALASGYAQVRKIQQTEIASPVVAETGGLLVGKRHSEGGIDVNAEDGEFIFSRKAVENIGVDNLMAMNTSYSRKIEVPVNPFPDRAPIASGKAGGDSNTKTDVDMRQYIDEIIAAQDRRIDRINVTNSAYTADRKGYQDQVDMRNRIQREADV